MSTTTNAIAGTYYAPGGSLYQAVATAGQTGNFHFALLTTEPPGAGPPLHLQNRHEELFFVLEGEIRFWRTSNFFVDFLAQVWYFSAIAALLSKRVLTLDSIRVRIENRYFSFSDFN